MRISDWSSDVCSSDLRIGAARLKGAGRIDVQPLADRALDDIVADGEAARPFVEIERDARADVEDVIFGDDAVLARRQIIDRPAVVGDPLDLVEAVEGDDRVAADGRRVPRSEEHKSELQSLMRTSDAVF